MKGPVLWLVVALVVAIGGTALLVFATRPNERADAARDTVSAPADVPAEAAPVVPSASALPAVPTAMAAPARPTFAARNDPAPTPNAVAPAQALAATATPTPTSVAADDRAVLTIYENLGEALGSLDPDAGCAALGDKFASVVDAGMPALGRMVDLAKARGENYDETFQKAHEAELEKIKTQLQVAIDKCGTDPSVNGALRSLARNMR